ncbi:MFS general substrate transporter [Choiromyces venosus 120613-1]|uniref:MFS general substrate transporter n=1 Tax=Choiromyces venosus 120613-1 TaxID=1336337 RepID=A0A3N4JXR4_9PEZI|nr:MFS general substrate transporter [Choiromyces venosus 120613-1]
MPKPKLSPPVVRQLIILSICRLAEPVSMTSVSPYLYFMVKSFDVPHKDIPFYVGIIFACFSFAQFFTGLFWGRASDKFGRKPTMLLGLSGTLISILIFGFSTSLPMAIFARCFSGLVNGNVGILRTMVAEMVPEKELQPRAFSIMPLIWTIGSIIGPAIGGSLADPVTNHPNWFKGEPPALLKKFPFCLPNLLNSALFVCGLLTGTLFLKETLETRKNEPDRGRQIGKKIIKFFSRKSQHHKDVTDETTSLLASSSSSRMDEEVNLPTKVVKDTGPPPLMEAFTFQSTVNIIVYCSLCLHTITYDQLLPVLMSYPRDDTPRQGLKFAGGFGMPSSTIGYFFSIYGVVGMLVQFFVFPTVVNFFGPLRTLKFFSLTFPILYFITPFSLLLPHACQDSALFLFLFMKSVSAIFSFPCSTILLTNSSPSLRLLGTLNGIAVALAALSKALGPAFGGLAFTLGQKTGYGILPWFLLSGITTLGTLPMILLVEGDGFSHKPIQEVENDEADPLTK